MKKIIVLTGAGISAESGVKTFRDSDGLWENHNVMDVASIQGWRQNKELVLDFYNQRRKQLFKVRPNEAHLALVELEAQFKTYIITQNVDDLHERAGSKNILHLHGKLREVRSEKYPNLIYPCDKDISLGDKCERGYQLRPNIVWFGEEVPLFPTAAILIAEADIILIIGTSMQVYPAAGLVGEAKPNIPIFYIDPHPQPSHELKIAKNLTVIPENATTGVRKIVSQLLNASGADS